MLLDFEVQRCTRRCTATDRALEPGDTYYSVLEVQGADILRKDYCADAWSGPPETAFGWWKSRVPAPNSRKIKLAPNDVLLELFDQLAEQAGREDIRYILTLLLIRRRVLRLEKAGNESGAHGAEYMVVYCPKRETTHEVTVAVPSDERVEEIQQQLSELLIADAE
jgi:hypothetical protein